jgi:hypothetical protein
MKRPLKEELEQYSAFYEKDTDFASNARLMQSKWRVKKNYPINTTKRSNYGNFIDTEFAEKEKINFLTAKIQHLVTEKIMEIRRNGGLIGEPRIWNNLLSSQPLCFNLFGELTFDLNLASRYFQKLFPDTISSIEKVEFEYSTKRDNPDNSAFDVFIEYYNLNQQKCFFGIEVKFQENLMEESTKKSNKIFQSHKSEYIKMTNDCKFFKINSIDKLCKAPLAQIWRDHLLAWNMKQDYYDGFFVFLYPFENKECHSGVEEYKNFLISNNEKETKFYPRDLTEFILALKVIFYENWIKDLEERYILKS